MGFRISYIAAEIPAEDLASGLGLTVSGEANEMPIDEALWVTRLKGGHSILWSEDELFGHDRVALLKSLSNKTQILNCIVNETVMASTAFCFDRGEEKWQIHWQGDDGPKPENLTYSGSPPATLQAEIDRQTKAQEGEAEVDYFFEVPLNIAAEICGFRHDGWLEADDVEGFWLLREKARPARPKPGFFARLFGGSK